MFGFEWKNRIRLVEKLVLAQLEESAGFMLRNDPDLNNKEK